MIFQQTEKRDLWVTSPLGQGFKSLPARQMIRLKCLTRTEELLGKFQAIVAVFG